VVSIRKPHRWLVLVAVILLAVALAGCGQTDQATSSPEPQHQSKPAHKPGHEHDEGLVEWSGVYELEAGTYSLIFGKSSHDPSIMVTFLDKSGYLEEGDDLVAHHAALHLMEAEPPLVAPGTRLKVADQACYNLTLEPEGTTYELHVPESGTYIVFTEHFAWEFDMQIVSADRTAVEPRDVREYAEPHAH